MKLQHDKRPLISICVPTFNRANCLENIFRNLEAIKRTFGEQVEICVSNNQSTDSTPQIIEAWRDRLTLKVVTQKKNIGATLNFVEVARLAGGKWIQIIGDDDELNFINFKKLMEFLQIAEEGDWILVGVDRTGKKNLLGDLKPGRYEAKAFRRTILRTGIFRFGFIGMHIFPSASRPQLLGLRPEESLGWPHIALFLRHLQGGQVEIFPDPVVSQAEGGVELFWYQSYWVKVNLTKLDIFAAARREMKALRWFFVGLILRDLYSPKLMMQLVKWRVLEPSDFHHKAFSEYTSRYRFLGPLVFLAAMHYMFVVVIYCTPHIVFRSLLRLIGENTISKYIARKEMLSRFDGEKRGL